MSKKIALCYLTHNHPDTVRDVLEKDADLYQKYEIDVYFCDDGDDTFVPDLIKEYRERGYLNLYFADAHDAEGADGKYYNVIRQKYVTGEYDYIWPVKDRVYFSEKVLASVKEEAEKDFDALMVVNDFDRWEIKWYPIKDVYDKPEEFFLHYGQLTTNWQSMIFSTKTLLNVNDWSTYETVYHMGSACPFNQTLTTFIRLYELKNPLIRVIHIGVEDIIMTNGESAWLEHIFDLWIDKWISAIFSLPSIYDSHKMGVVKAETNLFCLFGSVDMLLILRENGVLTSEIYEKYKGIWPNISDVYVSDLELICKWEDEKLYNHIMDQFLDAIEGCDYDRAYYLFCGNGWMSQIWGDKVHEELRVAFYVYRLDRISKGRCDWIEGVDSLESLLERFINRK